MSENWKYQLSLKIENHMLNIRAETGGEFSEQLAWIEEHRLPVLTAIEALAGVKKPQPAQAALTPAPVVPLKATSGEIGPIVLENVELKRGPRDGPPWKSPMYVVKWEGGASASTFDELNGKAAQGAWMNGNPCYLTVEPSPKNPKYLNLVSIRMAA